MKCRRHLLKTKGLKTSRFSRAHLGVFVLVFGAIGGFLLVRSFAATTGQLTANWWVSPTGSATCARSASPTGKTEATSFCNNNDYVYANAQPGDTVGLACGTYPNGALSTSTANPNLTSLAGGVSFSAESSSPQCVISTNGFSMMPYTSIHHVWVDMSACRGDNYSVSFTQETGPTTLASGMDASQTTLQVADPSGAPLASSGAGSLPGIADYFAVKIDNEYMYVTSGGTSVTGAWSVKRAATGSGSTAATHTVGAPVSYYTYKYTDPPCPGLGQSHDQLFDDIHTGLFGWNGNNYNVTIQNSEFGPSYDHHGIIGSSNSGSLVPYNNRLENSTIHDFWNSPDCINGSIPGCGNDNHQGCATSINAGHNLTFDRIHIYNCQDLPFYIHPYASDTPVHDITLSNSVIGPNAQPAQIYHADPGYYNLKFLNNTWLVGVSMLPSNVANDCSATDGSSGGCLWQGNAGNGPEKSFAPECSGNATPGAGWELAWNAKTGFVCGDSTHPCSTSTVCHDNLVVPSYGFAADGFHLTAGSPLADKIPAGTAGEPTADLDGDNRPTGSGYDIGADEYVPTANIWVSTTGDDATCARGDPTKPCSTFNQAYQIAQPGDLVEVAAGTYSTQIINWDVTKASVNCDGWVAQQGDVTPVLSGCITFTPAAGATVTFTGNISVYGNDVRLLNLDLGTGPSGHGLNINDGGCNAGAGNTPSYIILDGIQAHNFSINHSSHVALLNSTFNPNDTSGPAGQLGACDPDGSGPLSYSQADHLRISNSLFENVLESAGHHDGCIHATDAGITPATGSLTFFVLERSRFINCAEQDVEIQSAGADPSHDLLIENNYFAAACSGQPVGTGNNCGPIGAFTLGCSAVQSATPYYNIDFRFNTVDGALYTDTTAAGCSGLTSYRVYGNIMYAYSGASANYSCTQRVNAGILYRYNTWDGTALGSINCGDTTNVLVAAHQTVDPSVANGAVGSTTYDFHLASPSVAAANFITPGALTSPYGYPSTDSAGNTRPQGANYDAGAIEYITGTTPGDLNSDDHVNITDLSIMLSHYGDSATANQGDLNSDGMCTITDLSILLSHYGT